MHFAVHGAFNRKGRKERPQRSQRLGWRSRLEQFKRQSSKNWVGQALPRKEENRLLRGRGKFSDDIKLREMLYLRFVRSPYAHAKIVSVDTSAAEKLPGVVCALTGAEIVSQTQPFIEIGPDPFARIKDYPLAVVKVRYQGEPVAAVRSRVSRACRRCRRTRASRVRGSRSRD